MNNQPLSPKSTDTPASRVQFIDKALPKLWWAIFLVFATGVFIPLRFGLLRLGLVAFGTLLWIGGFYLLRRSRAGLLVLGLPSLLILGVLLAPGLRYNREQLREKYVSNLRSMTGIPYIWGAETRVALDCSGLVRYALIETNFQEGIRTMNPALLRTAASLWWNDTSAMALGESYRDLTVPVGKAKDLNSADYSLLRPGDLAVTAGGQHILAYLGNKTWIQADPVPMRVVQSPVPSDSGWFIQKTWFVRWRELE